MYKLISCMNSIIREDFMPNPFEFISEDHTIVMLFAYLIGGTILHTISFSMCGVLYTRGKAPILGSIGYMLAFSLNVGAIISISKLFNNIVLISISYIFFVVLVFKLLYKIKEKMFSFFI